MDFGIVKKILHAGTEMPSFTSGSKVCFHFKTTKCDPDKTVIDDSRIMGNHVELVLGKQFKLEVWEVIVQKMAIKEVAVFTVDKSLVKAYPFISKTLREVHDPKKEKPKRHCCGATLQSEGLGYDDLDDLLKNPQNLEFTIELLQVIDPNQYEKESWQMTLDEKLNSVPVLKEQGNEFFKAKNYTAAAASYAFAIGTLEQLMLSEKPQDPEWLELNAKKSPLLLNYAQCKLIEKDYYEVIKHCSAVLKYEPNNVKALFRRGKAHIGAWNEKEAISDLTKAAQLDVTLQDTVSKELKNFNLAIKERDKAQSQQFSNFFFKKPSS